MMHDDLPVVVALAPPLHGAVAAWVEQDLGWQVVEPGGMLAPALALAESPVGSLPWVAVTDGPPSAEAMRRHLTAGAADVVGWPHDRSRLAQTASRLAHGAAEDPTAIFTVAGVTGGAGTSTVALGIGGLLAWAGASVLVVGSIGTVWLAGLHDDDPTTTTRRDPTTSPEAAHRSVPGVPRLSVAIRGPDGVTPPWSGDIRVVDAGVPAVDVPTDLLVVRADVGLRRARLRDRPTAIVGDQPVGRRSAQRLLGRSPVMHLPLSRRVARAGVLGRVPAALPGAWLAVLRAGLDRLHSEES